MVSSYTTNSGIEKPGSGEQSGTWGATVNTNMDIIDTLVSGFVQITATGTSETLTTTDGTVTNGMNRAIKYVDGGDLGGDCTVTFAPNDQEKLLFVENGLSASRSLIFSQGSGANYTLQNGKQAIIRSDGAGSGAVVYGVLTNLEITTLECTGAAAIDGAITAGSTYSGGGLMTTGGNIVIPNAGNIGSASDTDAIAISSGGVVTMNQIPVFSAGINVSGGTIAGTLSTAAQGNVTSLGTLTTLTVDNIIINGTNIGHTSDTDAIAISSGGVVTMNQIPVFSAGLNVSGGTIAGTLSTAAQGNITSLGTLSALTVSGDISGSTVNATGDTASGDNAAIGYTSAEGLILTGQGSTSDVTIKNDADATVCYVPTGLDDLRFPDNAKLELGTGADLQIYHDGSDSYIADGGTGDLKIGGATNVKIQNANGSEVMGNFAADGAVTLYYDNSVKLATVTGGISVTGDTTTSGTFLPTGSFSAGDNAVVGYSSGDGLQLSGQGSTWDVVLKDDNGTDVMGIPTGTGNMNMGDSRKLLFGSGNDLAIYHDGSNSYIDDSGTGLLHIRGSQVNINKYTGENMATFVADGAVTLMHNHSTKIATTSAGVTITGTATATAFTGALTGNVTGNCTGTAATVTTAAQTSITSLGTLTALQVDNLNINGNTISATSGALNIAGAAGSAIVLDSTINVDAGVVTGATSITSSAFVGNITGNVTGNVSGTAATVTTAAQGNITSLGTLTTLTVDNVIINGTTIGHTGDTDLMSLAAGTLTVNGAMTATGDVTAFSDERLKENVSTIDDALAKVKEMRGVYYTQVDGGRRNVGVIAQEIQKILPEVVHEDKSEEKMLSVAYGNLVSVLIEAVKELTVRVEELEG